MENLTDIVPAETKSKKSNKSMYLIGALLLIGGYIAYKKFFVKKDDESTETDNTSSTSSTSEIPVNRGVVAPVYEPAPAMVVSESAPTLKVTDSNIATQSTSLPSNFAGLGKY